MNFAVADSIHKNAALMSTQVRSGPNVPVANLCPVPGALMSFGLDPSSATSHESSIARSQKHIYTDTLKLLSKSVVKILAEKGIAADANMGNIDEFWAHSESQLLNCDVDILVPSSSIGIFDPADYRFICETCNANNITPANLRKLREKAETMLTKITEHVAHISAACHTEDGRFNYILDPQWATDQQHDKIKMAAVTAAGHGSGTDPLFTQPSVMEPLSEHQTAVLQSALENKARHRFKMAGATEKHWDNKTDTLHKSWDPKNKRYSRVVSDPVSVLYLCAFDAASGGFKLDGVMANFRAQCFKEVLSIPFFEQTMLDQFNYLESANKDETRRWLLGSLLKSKDSEGSCFDDVEDWYYAVDRASAYQTNMPDLYNWAKEDWRLQAHHSKLLKKFTKGEHYDEGMEWVVLCDMYILMIAKKVRYTWSSMKNVIITRLPIVAAITKHVMNAIDNWPETQKFLRCVLQHIRPSFLTMPSHNMLKMLTGRAEVRARAEWQNSGAYMKYIEHTHAALTAIDCLNAETHNCFLSYNMKVDKFLGMIPSTKNSIPRKDRDNGIIDHHLTSLQLQYKKGFQNAMSFAYHCHQKDLSHWYHKNLEGLGKVHHVLRPILVNALLLILDDLTQQSTTHHEIDDIHFTSDSNMRSLTAFTSNVASCNSELERIVASKRISSKYVVDFISIVDDARRIRHAIDQAKREAQESDQDNKDQIKWPDTHVIGLVLDRLQPYSTPNEKVLTALESMGEAADDIYNEYRHLFHTYNHEMKDVMAFYSARDNAVMILLARCLIPFLANLPHDAVANSNLPVAKLQNDLWDTGPHQRLVQRLQLILEYGKKVHGISKEDAELYMTDHRSLIESMMQQNFASTMPEHITSLNTKAFVTIVQTLYCAGIHSNGAHSIAAYREERTRGFTPEQMESKQGYFRGQALGIVGTLQSEFIKRRECNTGDCDPNDCGAIAAGYWRQYCCSKAIQDIGENVSMTDGIRDRVKSVIEAVVSDTMPRRNRSGFIGRWKKQQHTLGGSMIIDDENTRFGRAAFGGASYSQPQKNREDRVKQLLAIVSDTDFVAIRSARRWALTEKLYALSGGMPQPPKLSDESSSADKKAEAKFSDTVAEVMDLLRKPYTNKYYKLICDALDGWNLHSAERTQYQNWKSVWLSIEMFSKSLFNLSDVSAAYFLAFICLFLMCLKEAETLKGDPRNKKVTCPHALEPKVLGKDIALSLIRHSLGAGIWFAGQLYVIFGYDGRHVGVAPIRGAPMDQSLKDIIPLFVTDHIKAIESARNGKFDAKQLLIAGDSAEVAKGLLSNLPEATYASLQAHEHNLRYWGSQIESMGSLCSYYTDETKAYISLMIKVLLYGMFEHLQEKHNNKKQPSTHFGGLFDLNEDDDDDVNDDSSVKSYQTWDHALADGGVVGTAMAEMRGAAGGKFKTTGEEEDAPFSYMYPQMHPKNSARGVANRALFEDDAVELRKRSKSKTTAKNSTTSPFRKTQIKPDDQKDLVLFEYAKGLVEDLVTGLEYGILKSTSELSAPAASHAQDLAKCVRNCLQSCLTARAHGESFKKLYDKLTSTYFDNTLQSKIQALFVSHVSSIPHNYWSEAQMTECKLFRRFLKIIAKNDWNQDEANEYIGAGYYFRDNTLLHGAAIAILKEDTYLDINALERGTCLKTKMEVFLDTFHSKWEKKDVQIAVKQLQVDCANIERYTKANGKGVEITDIQSPAARAYAYKLVHDEAPTRELQRTWHQHTLQAHQEQRPHQDWMSLFSSLKLKTTPEEAAERAVRWAKGNGIFHGDGQQQETVRRALEQWSKGLHDGHDRFGRGSIADKQHASFELARQQYDTLWKDGRDELQDQRKQGASDEGDVRRKIATEKEFLINIFQQIHESQPTMMKQQKWIELVEPKLKELKEKYGFVYFFESVLQAAAYHFERVRKTSEVAAVTFAQATLLPKLKEWFPSEERD